MKEFYREQRQTIETVFVHIYDQAVRMAEKVGTDPSKPRSVGRQQHRSNAPADTIQQYYTRNVAIPFLDHVVSELDMQFSGM